MELSKLLMPGAVRVVAHLTSKKRLFQELGEVASQAYGLNASAAVDGLEAGLHLGDHARFQRGQHLAQAPELVGMGNACGNRRIADLLAQRFAKAIKRLGMNHREGYNLDCTAFCPPGRQMSLI